jgi:uncharacterized small protein (DUF1192 family)
MDDDELPKTKAPQMFPRVLEGMSVASMQEYIGALEAEITKVKAEISKRGNIRASAESLFKS